MSIEKKLTRIPSTSSYFLLLPSFSGTPPLFRKVLLAGVMFVLSRMCVFGVIRLVRVHGSVGIVGQLHWVSLAGQLSCSQEDISKGVMVL